MLKDATSEPASLTSTLSI